MTGLSIMFTLRLKGIGWLIASVLIGAVIREGHVGPVPG